MSRPHDHECYELSDPEKRDLIKLIEQGKPLPDKYRFMLFADKRKVELVWNGKSREVCSAILPFQTLKHIYEPRKENRAARDRSPKVTRRAGRGLRVKYISDTFEEHRANLKGLGYGG